MALVRTHPFFFPRSLCFRVSLSRPRPCHLGFGSNVPAALNQFERYGVTTIVLLGINKDLVYTLRSPDHAHERNRTVAETPPSSTRRTRFVGLVSPKPTIGAPRKYLKCPVIFAAVRRVSPE